MIGCLLANHCSRQPAGFHPRRRPDSETSTGPTDPFSCTRSSRLYDNLHPSAYESPPPHTSSLKFWEWNVPCRCRLGTRTRQRGLIPAVLQVASGTGQGLPVNVFVQGTPMTSLETFSYALPEVSALKASPLGTHDFNAKSAKCDSHKHC